MKEVIHFPRQFLNITKFWCLPISYFIVVKSLTLHAWIFSLKNVNGWDSRSFCYCLVAIYYFETVLKNFGWEITSNIGRCFTSFKNYFKKICNFSLLKEAFSICTNFHDDWLKTWPDIRNLVFLLNEKLYRKSTAVLKVCQRWHHKWNAKTAITLDLNLTLVHIWFLN